MPSLADILSPARDVKVETPSGETLTVTYRPDSMTLGQELRIAEAQADNDKAALIRAFTEWAIATIDRWDLTNNDGDVWPLTDDALQTLPESVLMWIFEAVNADATPATAGESTPSAAG